MKSIADIRKDYVLANFDEADVHEDALIQFGRWWHDAVSSQIEEVNAMTLSTVTESGMPDARIVLLKGYDERGFVFYTNYHSAKGRQLMQRPHAHLLFFWKELERQVRISGPIAQVPPEESDVYFASRPLGSRIGAWASHQSQVIAGRHELEHRLQQLQQQFGPGPVPRPPHWGGYVVRPEVMEFWQGRSSRLHDRIHYSAQAGGGWVRQRLSP